MGMDQWRSENDSGAPIWSAKPACTRRREQAESRKTGWLSRGESVIGVYDSSDVTDQRFKFPLKFCRLLLWEEKT